MPSVSEGRVARTRAQGVSPSEPSPADRVPASEGLRQLYESYCERETRELLSLMPRAGLRRFYREARAWEAERRTRAAGNGPARDPMALARQFARHVLPLPSYQSWVGAYLADRAPFLQRLGIPTVPRRAEPVVVAVRAFGDGWYASLCLSERERRWTGFIEFHRSDATQRCRTGDVFRGGDVDDIQRRFHSFDLETLRAFLRSALP